MHGPGVDEPLVQYDRQADGQWGRQWLMADQQGSIVATGVDGGGPWHLFTYGPFGEPNWTGTDYNRMRYTGQWFDDVTQLYYYKARW